jgi:hypothetical protein
VSCAVFQSTSSCTVSGSRRRRSHLTPIAFAWLYLMSFALDCDLNPSFSNLVLTLPFRYECSICGGQEVTIWLPFGTHSAPVWSTMFTGSQGSGNRSLVLFWSRWSLDVRQRAVVQQIESVQLVPSLEKEIVSCSCESWAITRKQGGRCWKTRSRVRSTSLARNFSSLALVISSSYAFIVLQQREALKCGHTAVVKQDWRRCPTKLRAIIGEFGMYQSRSIEGWWLRLLEIIAPSHTRVRPVRLLREDVPSAVRLAYRLWFVIVCARSI